MHIIIEGPDGAGKTTLARNLQRLSLRPYGYHHEGPPPAGADPLEYYARLLLSHRVPTIFDRCHLGEVVYPPILRGTSSTLTNRGLRLMRRLVDGIGAKVVVCLPPLDVVRYRWAEKDLAGLELLKREAQLDESYRRFEAIAPAHADVVLYRACPSDRELRAILEPKPACPFGAIGSPDAKLLFVGERINAPNPVTDGTDVPFFCERNSSLFLNQALEFAGVEERDLALTNAYAGSGIARDLGRIASQFPNLRAIVALGAEAWNALHKPFAVPLGNVPLVDLPHPAYWKRFHAKEPDAYVVMIREIREAYCQ